MTPRAARSASVRSSSPSRSLSSAAVSAPSSGGGRPYSMRRPAESHRIAHARHLPRRRVRQLEAQPAMPDLRLVEHLGQVVDRAAGHLCRGECGQPLGRRPQPQQRLDRGHQHRAMRDPLRRSSRSVRRPRGRPRPRQRRSARTGRRCRPRASGGHRRWRTPGTGRCSGGPCPGGSAAGRSPGSSWPGSRARPPGCRAATGRCTGPARTVRAPAALPGCRRRHTCRTSGRRPRRPPSAARRPACRRARPSGSSGRPCPGSSRRSRAWLRPGRPARRPRSRGRSGADSACRSRRSPARSGRARRP